MAHHQCNYSGESGWGTVEVVGGFCEVGTGCVKACPYSWRKSDKKAERNADKRFKEFAAALPDGTS